MMRRVILLALAALGLVATLAGGAASVTAQGTVRGPVVDDGTGTSLAQTQRLSVREGDIRLTTVQQVCKTGYYVDGAVHARPCNTRDYEYGDVTWWSLYRLVWNPTTADGGHSDIFDNNTCWHVGTGSECHTGFISDGETVTQGTDRQSGFSSAWVQVTNSVGGYYPGYCKRYFFTWTGGASTSSC